MMRAHPNVIGSVLRSWEGPNGLKRWYYNKWDRYLSPVQIMDYRARFGVDPADEESGIRVFFDDKGYLHIDNCRDPVLESFLEDRMIGWYRWARDEYRMRQGLPQMNILETIDPYTKELKPGFYQTRYEDTVFNFDEEAKFAFSEMYLPYDPHSDRFHVNTGFPRLDEILSRIIDSEGPASSEGDAFLRLFG